MLLNFVFLFVLGGLLGAENPLILTNIHTLNQEWVHVNGLGPWSGQLEMSAPESSETFGSRVLITLDSQSGTVLLSHCGDAFVGIFRAGDVSVDILHPAQNLFCAKEEGLPAEEAVDVLVNVQNNDIIFTLLPSKTGWDGIKPVDLQGAMYGVEAGDSESFTDFVENLPKVLKDFNCAVMVCTVSDKPKGLCEPCKLMYSTSHKESFVSFDGNNDEFTFPFITVPRISSSLVFSPLEMEDSEAEERHTTTGLRPLSSSSRSESLEFLFNHILRARRLSLSSSTSVSSSTESGGDYNYRSHESSEVSSELSDEGAYVPGQDQESIRGLNTMPGFLTNPQGPGQAHTIQRKRPASRQDDFPDLNVPISTPPCRSPRSLPVIHSSLRNGEVSAGPRMARFIQINRDPLASGTSPSGGPAPIRPELSTQTARTIAGQSAERGTARLGGHGVPVINRNILRTRSHADPVSTGPSLGRPGRVALQQQRANEEQPEPISSVRPREDSDDDNGPDHKRIRR